ncbi:hypothetical protein HK104_011511 [Borealophlyctis nickersoniae]|nr:hypothetical protein HK104_011511 [Borealophlyctis nickersoniae]
MVTTFPAGRSAMSAVRTPNISASTKPTWHRSPAAHIDKHAASPTAPPASPTKWPFPSLTLKPAPPTFNSIMDQDRILLWQADDYNEAPPRPERKTPVVVTVQRPPQACGKPGARRELRRQDSAVALNGKEEHLDDEVIGHEGFQSVF